MSIRWLYCLYWTILKNAENNILGIERRLLSYAEDDIKSAKNGNPEHFGAAANVIIGTITRSYNHEKTMAYQDFAYTMRDAFDRKATRGDFFEAIEHNKLNDNFPMNCIKNLSVAHRIFRKPNQEFLDALEHLKM